MMEDLKGRLNQKNTLKEHKIDILQKIL